MTIMADNNSNNGDGSRQTIGTDFDFKNDNKSN